MKQVEIISSTAPNEWKSKVKVRAYGKEITKECIAVFDTGAYISAISKNVFDSIQAEIMSYAENHTPIGKEIVGISNVDIELCEGCILKNNDVTVATHDMDCDILIGMNTLTRGDLHLFRDSDGLYKCTFRIYENEK